TVISETPRAALIRPGSSNGGRLWNTVGIVGMMDKSYVEIDGFTTDGTGIRPYHFYISGNSHHINLTNNEVRYGNDLNSPTNSLGFVSGYDVHDIIVRGNTIHDLGQGAVPGQAFYSYGFYWHASNSLIERNEIHGCSGYGIHMYNTIDGMGNGNIVRQNLI